MEYHINEKRLMELIGRFLNNRKKPNVVCDYLIDFDSDFDRIVVNIFYKKDTKQAHAFLVEDKVIQDLYDYFRISPLIYTHIGDC